MAVVRTRMTKALHQDRLVARARSGDRGAFDELVRGHFAEVYRVLFRTVGNHEDAEDLTQECFVRAYRSLRFYRGEGSFGAWLGRIALHLARDHHRARGRGGQLVSGLEPTAFDPPARAPEPGRALTHKELVQKVGEAVAGLPHALRAAIVLRVLEGRDYEEVAEALDLRPGTVRTQVMKARRALMRALRPWLDARGGGEDA